MRCGENQRERRARHPVPAVVVLMLAGCMALCGCSASGESQGGGQAQASGGNTITDNSSHSNESATSSGSSNATATKNTIGVDADSMPVIGIGESVETADFVFTLEDVSFSYDVNPDNPPSYYHHYAADTGKVYLHVKASVYNTSKRDISSNRVYSTKAYYGDGYTYTGFAVADDSDGDFASAQHVDISQLASCGVHSLIECPEQVCEDTDSGLYVVITMLDKTKYKYVVR